MNVLPVTPLRDLRALGWACVESGDLRFCANARVGGSGDHPKFETKP